MLKIQVDDHTYDQKNALKQYDASRKHSLILTQRNQSLRYQQTQEIHIATLQERNRIAREIHDTVGHLLSSALLQIGALQTLSKDAQLDVPIQNLQTTVAEGMDTLRCSVHDLHVHTIQLKPALEKLIAQYTFAKVDFAYRVVQPISQIVSYHIIAILKECFTNTIKHSNASQVWVSLIEHPSFYQFIIKDNGTKKAQTSTDGLGLKNIHARVIDVHGHLQIDVRTGFQMFIAIPKEEATYASITY